MELSNDVKSRILDAIKDDRANYPSDTKHAAALGISAPVYNLIKRGETEHKLAHSGWISIARRLGVTLRNEIEVVVAETPTYIFITEQLRVCQEGSISAMLCDIPNIGKTFVSRVYVRSNKNAVYIDCSQVKTKTLLVAKISREFGLSGTGRYSDMYEDLVYYLRSIERPLVVLDEAGDMCYEAFLELKALWNATERCCGWYMMGADGLQDKIERMISGKKVGYAEIFSRYGERYGRVTPIDGKERQLFRDAQVAMFAKLNAPEGADIRRVVNVSGGSLRRALTEIEKLRQQA